MYTCTNVFVGVQGKGGRVSSAWWQVRTAMRFAFGTSSRIELCMVTCHNCHIYGIWTSRSIMV